MRTFGTAKELAHAGGFSVYSAVRYQRGESFPNVLTLTRLMAASRAIAEAVLRAAGMDDLSMDIEQARLLRSLAELQAKRLALHADVVALGQVSSLARGATSAADQLAGGARRRSTGTPRRKGEAA
jgi:hypothetical protein